MLVSYTDFSRLASAWCDATRDLNSCLSSRIQISASTRCGINSPRWGTWQSPEKHSKIIWIFSELRLLISLDSKLHIDFWKNCHMSQFSQRLVEDFNKVEAFFPWTPLFQHAMLPSNKGAFMPRLQISWAAAWFIAENPNPPIHHESAATFQSSDERGLCHRSLQWFCLQDSETEWWSKCPFHEVTYHYPRPVF